MPYVILYLLQTSNLSGRRTPRIVWASNNLFDIPEKGPESSFGSDRAVQNRQNFIQFAFCGSYSNLIWCPASSSECQPTFCVCTRQTATSFCQSSFLQQKKTAWFIILQLHLIFVEIHVHTWDQRNQHKWCWQQKLHIFIVHCNCIYIYVSINKYPWILWVFIYIYIYNYSKQ